MEETELPGCKEDYCVQIVINLPGTKSAMGVHVHGEDGDDPAKLLLLASANLLSSIEND